MHRRIPEQVLRGSDTMMLEMQCTDLLRRPMGQLCMNNIMDLIELYGTPGCPKTLRKPLKQFVQRIQRQIADLPAGASFTEYLQEVEEIDGARMPTLFKDVLAEEAEKPIRTGDVKNQELLAAIMEKYAEAEPTPFPLNERSAKGTQFELKQPARKADPSAAPKERKARAKKAGTSAAAKKPRRIAQASKEIDPVRLAFLEKLCMTILSRSSNGLSEHVLLAGVGHQSKQQYTNVTPKEILNVLKGLQDKGQTRYSARNWCSTNRW